MIPNTLGSFHKFIVDLKMAARAIRLALRKKDPQARTPMSLQHFGRVLRSQSAFGRMMKQRKYTSFGGKAYFDLYMPGFPSLGFDRLLQQGLGQSDGAGANPRRFIANVDLAITGRCMFRCEHCYASEALLKKDIVSVDQWKGIIDGFQQVGVGVFGFVGGEPLLRFDDMLELCEYASRKSDVWTVTTGYGLTASKARALKDAGLQGAAVSLDHYLPEKHNEFRGNKKAFDEAVKGIALFGQAGIYPALAICSTRDMLEEDGLLKYLELAVELGAGAVQIVEPIRSGKYSKAAADVALTTTEILELQRQQRLYNTAKEYAHLPAITSRSSLEDSSIGGGCGAGGNSFIYVDPSGHLQPCPMLNVSTGNLVDDGFDRPFDRMRKLFPRQAAIGPQCPANTLADHIAEAHERTDTSPLPPDETDRLMQSFVDAPLAALAGGKLLASPWEPSVEGELPPRRESLRILRDDEAPAKASES